MSKTCDKCGRGPRASISKSHSQVKTKIRQFVNLQTKTVGGKKMQICTRCIKTLAKA